MSKIGLHIGHEFHFHGMKAGLRDYEAFVCPEVSKSRVPKSKDIAV